VTDLSKPDGFAMEAAYPSHLRHHLPAVRSHLAQTRFSPVGTIAGRTWGEIVVDRETLLIPHRQYDRPLGSPTDAESRLLWLAWFTRHHDGRIRQQSVRGLFERPSPWVVAFIVQLLGEYVIEICDDIASFVDTTVRRDPEWMSAFQRFCAENPRFVELTKARTASYWNEYYRRRLPNQADYPAHRALALLDNLCEAPIQGAPPVQNAGGIHEKLTGHNEV
jgi:hypothetical protein